MRKNRVDSSLANSMVSASVESSSDFEFVHGLFRDEGLHFAGDAFELLAAALDVRQAMAVGRNHGDRFGLQHHQRAI